MEKFPCHSYFASWLRMEKHQFLAIKPVIIYFNRKKLGIENESVCKECVWEFALCAAKLVSGTGVTQNNLLCRRFRCEAIQTHKVLWAKLLHLALLAKAAAAVDNIRSSVQCTLLLLYINFWLDMNLTKLISC